MSKYVDRFTIEACDRGYHLLRDGQAVAKIDGIGEFMVGKLAHRIAMALNRVEDANARTKAWREVNADRARATNQRAAAKRARLIRLAKQAGLS